ncbi:MAG: hypothetical protein E4H14_12630 [Candidatus Thorarchaeota archaeon]|nr:MAG: hypothetical protein E4H14_12630 [Candidatus Thorarchaeota archaeon]
MVLTILLACQPIGVQAHSPESMTLEYDWETQVLTVYIEHHVSDPLTHYISEITVYKNSGLNEVAYRDYENQTTTSGMSDTFEITTLHGDVLIVTASCIE